MKIDSGAEAKIITEDTFNILRPKPTLSNTNITLTPYASAPLDVLGEFTANIKAYSRQINTNLYVVRGPAKHNLLSRYTGFDLEILRINVNNEPIPINIHNLDQSEEPQTSKTHEVQHLSYQDMAKKLTPLDASKQWLKQHTTTKIRKQNSLPSLTNTQQYSKVLVNTNTDK